MSDITETLAPNSDQIDAIDLHHSGPRTFTVERVVVNKSDQPVNIHLLEIDRVYRPSKNMRRALAECWGPDSAQWTDHRMTLYCDPEVTFGRDKTGGVRISHLSHITSVQKVPIIVSRGKTGLWPVKPLDNAPAPQQQPQVTEAHVAASSNEAQLREWWNAHPNLRAVIEARVAELKGATETNGGE